MLHTFVALLSFGVIASTAYKNEADTTAIGVPITYYPGRSESVQVGETQCYVINQCNGGMAGYTQSQLVIDLPQNPLWDLQKGFVLAEISTCPDSYNSTCVKYTNYIWNDGLNIIAYSNITFTGTGNLPLYIRFTSVQAPADYTFQLTYGQYGNDLSGIYDFDAFGTSLPCSTNSAVAEFARPSAVIAVSNVETQYYQLQFCINNNFPSNSWSATINVASTLDKPKSAFEVFACSADKTVANCKTTHNDGENLAAISVVSMSISNTQSSPINNGIIIGVYGIGAEYDLNNEGTLTVTVPNS